MRQFLLFLALIFGALTTGYAANNYRVEGAAGSVVTVQSTDTGTAHIPAAQHVSQYPTNSVGPATPITISATGTTNSTAATLAAVATKTTFVCGISIRSNATAAATGNATVAGTITGTMNFTHWTAPLASGIGTTEQQFFPCVPASAANTTIVVTGPAPGAGGTISVSAWGYQL